MANIDYFRGCRIRMQKIHQAPTRTRTTSITRMRQMMIVTIQMVQMLSCEKSEVKLERNSRRNAKQNERRRRQNYFDWQTRERKRM